MTEETYGTLNEWWGYLHENGSIQVKRYFDITALEDADESPFVVRRTGPFRCESREKALEIIKERLKPNA